MKPAQDRLAALPDGELAGFVRRLGDVWPRWERSVSPPSPDGSVELSLRRGDERGILRVVRGDVDAPAVEELGSFARERGLSFALLACTGETTAAARATAAESRAELYDGTGLVSLARSADVRLPGDADDLDAFLEERVAGYPPGLADRAGEVVRAVDERADFDREPSYGDASTTLDLSLDGRRVARVRFGPASVAVYAETGDGLETVASLTAHRERQPSVAELGVVDAVDRALDRVCGEP